MVIAPVPASPSSIKTTSSVAPILALFVGEGASISSTLGRLRSLEGSFGSSSCLRPGSPTPFVLTVGSFLGLRGISGALSGSGPLIGFAVLSMGLRGKLASPAETGTTEHCTMIVC